MYSKPQISDLGSLASLTLTPGNGGIHGIANGKHGSVADGLSGLTGNRSGG
jgi:hypothetical protein